MSNSLKLIDLNVSLDQLLLDPDNYRLHFFSGDDSNKSVEKILDYQTSTTLSGWRQLTWPVFWLNFKACFLR